MRRRCLQVLVLAPLLVASTAMAEDYYVALDGDDAASGSASYVTPQAALETDPAIVHRGTASMRTTATKGENTGGDVDFDIEPAEEQIYLRFYTKFHADTIMPHHFVKLRAIRPSYSPNAGTRPPGDQAFWTGIEPRDDQTWHFYTYWHEMHSWQTVEGDPNGQANPYYGNNFTPEGQTPFEKDVWICVEAMLKANTVGSYDGEQAFWINGFKVGHYRTGEPVGNWVRDNFYSFGTYFDATTAQPFEGYNWRTDSAVQINQIILQWYQSHDHAADSPTDYNIVYFDDVVLAREYIGCRYEGDPLPDGGTGGAAGSGGTGGAGGSSGGVLARVLVEAAEQVARAEVGEVLLVEELEPAARPAFPQRLTRRKQVGARAESSALQANGAG